MAVRAVRAVGAVRAVRAVWWLGLLLLQSSVTVPGG